MATAVTILDVVRLIRGAWPRAAFNKETEGAYCLGLEDLDPDRLLSCVMAMMDEFKNLPTIADVKESYYAGRAKLAGGGEGDDRCSFCHHSLTDAEMADEELTNYTTQQGWHHLGCRFGDGPPRREPPMTTAELRRKLAEMDPETRQTALQRLRSFLGPEGMKVLEMAMAS